MSQQVQQEKFYSDLFVEIISKSLFSNEFSESYEIYFIFNDYDEGNAGLVREGRFNEVLEVYPAEIYLLTKEYCRISRTKPDTEFEKELTIENESELYKFKVWRNRKIEFKRGEEIATIIEAVSEDNASEIVIFYFKKR